MSRHIFRDVPHFLSAWRRFRLQEFNNGRNEATVSAAEAGGAGAGFRAHLTVSGRQLKILRRGQL